MGFNYLNSPLYMGVSWAIPPLSVLLVHKPNRVWSIVAWSVEKCGLRPYPGHGFEAQNAFMQYQDTQGHSPPYLGEKKLSLGLRKPFSVLFIASMCHPPRYEGCSPWLSKWYNVNKKGPKIAPIYGNKSTILERSAVYG